VMKAAWLEEFSETEVLVAADAPDQWRYGATTGKTHYERTQKDDEDNRC
jgi:hypothetical protein